MHFDRARPRWLVPLLWAVSAVVIVQGVLETVRPFGHTWLFHAVVDNGLYDVVIACCVALMLRAG